MCGLTGFWHPDGFCVEDAKALASAMAEKVIHRGPDDSGVWVDAEAGIALAHRRLSIVDLSPAGHQPMVSSSGRYVLIFNGEIYNHLELRKELVSSWRGHSDTETLLAAFQSWGVEGTLKKLVGMFAIALWDKDERALFLARDRMGEKPLYYGWQEETFLYGSELKALKAHPSFRGEIDRNSVALLLRHNYIPAPYSIYQGICKLPPGCFLRIQGVHRLEEPVAYWSLEDVTLRGAVQPFKGNDEDAVAALEDKLVDAIRLQMMAEVPLGAFLSGGIDSSTVVALMQTQSIRPVKTFTIGFHEKEHDEAKYARRVAQYLGADHTEMYVSAEQALAAIPKLPDLYDEPFADSSQIPTYLLSQLAKQHVTVSLSGDAGDELFGGYSRYVRVASTLHKVASIPVFLRKMSAATLRSLPESTWDALFRPVSALQLNSMRLGSIGHKVHRVADILNTDSSDETYRDFVSHWKCPESVVMGSTEPPTVFTGKSALRVEQEFEHRMMYLDAMSYLPDDILVKVDRAAMGVSLETRVPFLDHRVVEFAWTLPMRMKIRDGQGKWILKQVLQKYLPKELVERPKMGFGVPLGSWLRGSLRDWAEGLLDESRLEREGIFNPEPIRQKWQEHLSGRQDWHSYLWSVLMFQAWLEGAA